MVADGYKDTDVGVIPVEWEVKYVKDIAKIKTGKKDTQDKEEGGEYPFFVRSQTIERINSYSFDGEAVLTAGDGVGVGKIYHYLNEKFDYHQRVYNIHNFADDISGRYFYEYFKATFYSRVSRMSAKNSVDSVRLDMIAKMEIPLPPLKEQEKIADILSTADEKIDAIEGQIQKAQTLKKGLQKKLFIEGIEHTKFKDTGLSIVYPMRRIPEAWELKKLSDITTKITDGAHFTPTYVKKGIPFLRVTDLKSKNLLASDIKYIPKDEHIELIKRCKPEYGDILYSKNGTIGLTRIITWDWEFSIFVSLCLIKPKRSLIIPEYLKYYLTSDIVNTQIKIRSKQGTVTNLHLEEIRDFFITVPPLEEQQQIANILLAADEKVEVLKAKKEKYETLKKGLLQKLLSGEVRV